MAVPSWWPNLRELPLAGTVEHEIAITVNDFLFINVITLLHQSNAKFLSNSADYGGAISLSGNAKVIVGG